MATPAQLWNEIDAALAAMPANLTAGSDGADLYEAYIWSIVLAAAAHEGAIVIFKDRNGASPGLFWFRTQPSGIFSSAHNYCHAEIAFTGCPVLEAHVGIYVAGRSQVKHECDVAVLYQSEAATCRQEGVHPRSGKVLLTVECKFYLNANIGIDLGRSFLGLLHDIYNGDRFFVGSRPSASVGKLLGKHNKEYELGLSPLDPHLQQRLQHAFEKTFRDFRSSWT